MEEWKDVPNYEFIYQVSNFGRVKVLERKVWNGKVFYKRKSIILKLNIKYKYHTIQLNKNNKSKRFYIHQLVCMAFLNHNPCGHKIVVDHINNIKTDNRLTNLQLISTRKNTSKDSKGKSIYTGVHCQKKTGAFISSITIKKKKVILGSFKNELDAHYEYERALKQFNLTGEIKRPFINKKTSIYKGVYYCRKNCKWVSRFYNKKTKKSTTIGRYNSEIEAYNKLIKFQHKLENNK